MSVLEIKNVDFFYNKKTPYEVHALKNINLSIGPGITGIIGHTGSGKSTLVRLFNALLSPDSGDVSIDGESIFRNAKTMKEARFKVGLVMQYPEYQLFASSVEEDIAFGPSNMGLSEEQINERVKFASSFASLPEEIMSRSPFDISGGQKRRVALAGVIAMSPQFLVLDEPAAGLDPGGKSTILGGLKEYQDETSSSVIIVSHSMEDMAEYCDRIIVMSHGEVLMDGTPAEVYSHPDVLKANGLDVPLITSVALELKKRGIDIGDDIYTVGYAYKKLKEVFESRKRGDRV